jgi:hypothetical protein
VRVLFPVRPDADLDNRLYPVHRDRQRDFAPDAVVQELDRLDEDLQELESLWLLLVERVPPPEEYVDYKAIAHVRRAVPRIEHGQEAGELAREAVSSGRPPPQDLLV